MSISKPVQDFYNELRLLHKNIVAWDDFPHRFAFGTDASFYRLTPQLIVQAGDELQLITIMQLSQKWQVAITFRAAGTSLSGQAVTDSVLVTLGSNWSTVRIENNGELVHLKPGVIGSQANLALAAYGRKIGPDPASINSCKIGGIAANNASGMCCGTASNTYNTLAGIRMVLSDGTVLDTRDSKSIEQFKQSHKTLVAGLEKLIQETKENQQLTDRINHKYRIKNTTGYSLNALVDYKDPIDALAHLMIGSEGTLGFISEITYNTVVEEAYKAANLVGFATVESCCKAVMALKSQPVSAVELVDYRGLRTASKNPAVPDFVQKLPNGAAAILIDVRGETAAELKANINAVEDCLKKHPVADQSGFSSDAGLYAKLWAFRKGLFPAVGAVRKTGTTVIIEDVAFPIESLAEGVNRLQQCFEQHNYSDALIFGHALEGNLHFVFSQAFSSAEEISRYERFMADVSQLVAVEFGGSLKAEHGTGRNMAPFVELEWGKDAYQLMKQIKQLVDPGNRLNPGVILNDNANVHIENLKTIPAADPLVDKCIECGFCEPACPSRNLTYTPRQRITMWREIQRMRVEEPNSADLKSLEQDYFTLGLDSCAATGMCAERCPVGINTGDLVKQHRIEENDKHPRNKKRAAWAEKHLGGIIATAKIGIGITQVGHDILGTGIVSASSKAIHKISAKKVPLWTEAMPRVAKKVAPVTPDKVDFIYWPSCVSQVMGPAKKDPNQKSQMQVMEILAERAGLGMLIPEGLEGLCCGQPFASKGFPEQAELSKDKLLNHLMPYVNHGKPVVSDTSPCALRAQSDKFQVIDSLTFIDEYLIPKLNIKRLNRKIALHVPCTAKRNKLTQIALDIANRCSDNVVMPADIECCGFAGDKGFTQPELNASALESLKPQVVDCDGGFSSSRTCEIGLSSNSGISYQSLLYLLEEASR